MRAGHARARLRNELVSRVWSCILRNELSRRRHERGGCSDGGVADAVEFPTEGSVVFCGFAVLIGNDGGAKTLQF